MYPEHISGMVLCNPLVITDEGLARSTIRHYYCKRLFEKEFLKKLVRFDLNVKNTLISLWESFQDAGFLKHDKSGYADSRKQTLPAMVIDGLHKFTRPIRIILSTDDIVAANFQDELNKSAVLEMDYSTNKIINHVVKGADHTFIDPWAKNELFTITLNALNDICSINSLNTEKGCTTT
jgi:hypothetical protein